MGPGDKVRVVRVREDAKAPNWEWFLNKEGTIVRAARIEQAWRVALDARPEVEDLIYEDELELIQGG